MGLDLVLGLIILIAALRGWFKGFTNQAVRIAGFIACFYLADPVREQARPYVLAKLPTHRSRIAGPDPLVDLRGRLVHRPGGIQHPGHPVDAHCPGPGVPRSRRDDRFAGSSSARPRDCFSWLSWPRAFRNTAIDLAHNFPWTERQTEGSYALQWTDRYQPVPRIWSCPAGPPVRRAHPAQRSEAIRSKLQAGKQVAERTLGRGRGAGAAPRAGRSPRRSAPAGRHIRALDLDPELVKELEGYKSELQSRRRRPERDRLTATDWR